MLQVLKPVELQFKCAHIVPSQFNEGVLDMPWVMISADGGSSPAQSSPSEDTEGFRSFFESRAEELLVSALVVEDTCIEKTLLSLKLVHSNFSLHRLPSIVRCYQQDVLDALHSACSARRAAAHLMSFCLVCAINGKGFQSKLRMCSISRGLSCITCQPGAQQLLLTVFFYDYRHKLTRIHTNHEQAPL